jgi:pimeloyl-ACP methyl ester carboxylesterase
LEAIPLISASELATAMRASPVDLSRKIFGMPGVGVTIPFRIFEAPRSPSEPFALVVVFHGAINRSAVKYPVFYGHRLTSADYGGDRLVIGIGDPTLERSGDLTVGWYNGWAGVDVPAILSSWLKALVEELSPERTIMVGGSTGAHAAMRHAAALPTSLLISANPLPRISIYYKNPVDKFVKACWPEHTDADQLPPEVLDSATDAFSNRRGENRFIFLQNVTDPHLPKQFAPTIVSLAAHGVRPSSMLPLTFFAPNAIGHAFPPEILTQWLNAAVLSPELDVRLIALTHARLFGGSRSIDPQSRAQDTAAQLLDRALADKLVISARGSSM